MGNLSTRNSVPEPDVRKMGFALYAPVDQLGPRGTLARCRFAWPLRIDALTDGGCLSCRVSNLLEGGHCSTEASMLAMF